eukprot:TRINITY_DN1531_c0_g3_i2.p1 TRINITY_DN1531_c0_g3~~TRINITY_DN1531_c0_g3_i2.p1  ORF type:complete len:378 (+),score=69.21 TRINITY_DN1531_c0_g3_i2:477-1610(+)
MNENQTTRPKNRNVDVVDLSNDEEDEAIVIATQLSASSYTASSRLQSTPSTLSDHTYVKQYTRIDPSASRQLAIDSYLGRDVDTCTRDVISMLRPLLVKAAATTGSRFYLCSEMDHYASGPGDFGWGCGYRNIQMLSSALMRSSIYKASLFGGLGYVPGVGALQTRIEEAWNAGYDAAGSLQLNSWVYGSSKFIGSSEGCVLLRKAGIPSILIDFHQPSGDKMEHPLLFEWVWNYFENAYNNNHSLETTATSANSSSSSSSSSAMNLPLVPPLYFQHTGHSRTIVGIERTKKGAYNMIVLDPGQPKHKLRSHLSQGNLGPFRKSIAQLRHPQYQLIAVGRKVGDSTTTVSLSASQSPLMSSTEQESSKLLSSLRIPS